MIYIIGAGLFGSMAATLLRKNGIRCTVIDCNKPRAGSLVAACLIRPSWVSTLPAEVRKVGMDTLHELYNVEQRQFTLYPTGKTVSLTWVNPYDILLDEDSRLTVRHVSPEGRIEALEAITKQPVVIKEEDTDAVLVAAGVWSEEILWEGAIPEIRALAGVVCKYGAHVEVDNFIKVWAPYKQIVGFHIEPHVFWIGDGSAILKKNWTYERRKQSVLRCEENVPLAIRNNAHYDQMGYRPYMKGLKGYFKKLSPKIYCSSNGAKNGTLIAAYQARCFVEEIMNAH